jgi:Fe2+ or Zn2+ uptake regulation protein
VYQQLKLLEEKRSIENINMSKEKARWTVEKEHLI